MRDTAIADRDLIRGVADRDPSALAQLYDHHAAAAYGVALAVCADERAAEDVVREAFLAVWRGSLMYAGGSVATWLMTVVHAQAVRSVRPEAIPG